MNKIKTANEEILIRNDQRVHLRIRQVKSD